MQIKTKGVTTTVTPSNTHTITNIGDDMQRQNYFITTPQDRIAYGVGETKAQSLARTIARLADPDLTFAQIKAAYLRRYEDRVTKSDLKLIAEWERMIALASLPSSQIIITDLSPV
jgi:hypothetical protein